MFGKKNLLGNRILSCFIHHPLTMEFLWLVKFKSFHQSVTKSSS